jgi:linoleoyl-CoA desaturase
MFKVHDKHYDITNFINLHPGGTDMFRHLKPYTNITPMIYAYHIKPMKILEVLKKYEVDDKCNASISYDTNYTYDNYCKLKELVYKEIYDKKIPLYWTKKEIAYNAFMSCIYLGIWRYCFWNVNDISHWWMILLSLFIVGHVALIFHETSHYIGFKSQKVNTLISSCIVYPFLSVCEWKERHNFLHHCFTNTKYDQDFDKNKLILRHSNEHVKYTHHKFQYLYAMILFLLNGYNKTIIRSIKSKDYIQLLGVTFIYYWFGFMNALILFGSIGFGYTFIANLSHIQYECIQINTENKNDFLYNQVSSSMNYKTDDVLSRFICFGLDIQIEHHLFPNIPHSSLRKIKHVVRKYCENNNIPYIEKENMAKSIYSYILYLYNMGNNY